MTTHSRIADLTLQLSGRMARLRQGPRAQRTAASVGVSAFESSIRTAAPSGPTRTTTSVNRPMARRRAEGTMLHKIVVFALAVALSGAAVNVAAARGGGGGGHGGGFGHMGGGIGRDFVAGSGGGFGGSHVGGFGGGHVGGFGSSPVGGFEGSHFAGYGGSHVGGFGGFDSHLGGPSVGRFQGAPLAINPGHFTSPSALAGKHPLTTGARLSMHYTGHHRMRYYAGNCFIAANDPYYCDPSGYCPCSTLP